MKKYLKSNETNEFTTILKSNYRFSSVNNVASAFTSRYSAKPQEIKLIDSPDTIQKRYASRLVKIK